MRILSFLAILMLLCLSSAIAAPTFPPGSRIGLVPADGMEFSRTSGLFENPSKYASVRMREMKPEDYPVLEQTLMDPRLKDMKVIFQERTMIGGYPAVLVTANQKSKHGFLLRKWLLAVREPTLTMFIVVQSIETPRGYTDAAIRQMLNSVVARPTVPIEAEMTELPFKISDRAGFRPVRMDLHQIVMTEGLSDDLHLLQQPMIRIAFTSVTPPKLSDKPDFPADLLKLDRQFKDVTIQHSQPFQYQGRQRHEIVARAKDAATGQPVILMQVLEFDRRGLLQVNAVTRPSDKDDHLPRFRSLADGIAMRR
jgi:hypothetical protein